LLSVSENKFNPESNEHELVITKDQLIKQALEVCRLERVMVGNHYLPHYFIDSKESADLDNIMKNFISLAPHSCTGRIFADLSCADPKLYLETKTEERLREFVLARSSVYPLKIMLLKAAENALIYTLTHYCTKRSIHFLQFIQKGSLLVKNLYREEEAQRLIFDTNQECREYASSIQCYDLEDLVDIQKNESNPDTEGLSHSVSYTIGYPKLMFNVFDIFNNHAEIQWPNHNPVDPFIDYQKYKEFKPTKEHWVVIVSKHEYLSKIVKDKCHWPHTSDEAQEKRLEDEQNKKILCLFCLKYYTEKENDDNSCKKHTGSLKHAETDNPYTYKIALKSKISEQQKLVWTCCLGGFKAGGCTDCSHTNSSHDFYM